MPDMVNPGALGGAAGARKSDKRAAVSSENTPQRAANARARGRAKAAAVLAALDDLDAVQLHRVGEHVAFRLRGAGTPLPPLYCFKSEAESWVRFAARDELRAYLVAIWRQLPEKDHRTFLNTVRRRRAA